MSFAYFLLYLSYIEFCFPYGIIYGLFIYFELVLLYITPPFNTSLAKIIVCICQCLDPNYGRILLEVIDFSIVLQVTCSIRLY